MGANVNPQPVPDIQGRDIGPQEPQPNAAPTPMDTLLTLQQANEALAAELDHLGVPDFIKHLTAAQTRMAVLTDFIVGDPMRLLFELQYEQRLGEALGEFVSQVRRAKITEGV